MVALRGAHIWDCLGLVDFGGGSFLKFYSGGDWLSPPVAAADWSVPQLGRVIHCLEGEPDECATERHHLAESGYMQAILREQL